MLNRSQSTFKERQALDQARNQASMRALVEHERRGTDLSQRVDMFDIIQQERIWLIFQPLKSVYGAYMREENNAAGILIHSGHPSGLQRFTGAHEFGHHVLGHTASVDDSSRIEPSNQQSDAKEAAANTFANEFLMPLELVNAVFSRMGLPPDISTLTARQVYDFSLEVGVSYKAAVSRLVGLKRITVPHARTLRVITPQSIKQEIGGGIGPAHTRADVWALQQTDTERELMVKPHDEIHILLPSNPSTGYIWTIDNSDIHDLRGDDLAAQNASGVLGLTYSGAAARQEPARNLFTAELPVGRGGEHRFVFEGLTPGTLRLRLTQCRPWQRATIATFEANIRVVPAPTGDSERGLSENQKTFLA